MSISDTEHRMAIEQGLRRGEALRANQFAANPARINTLRDMEQVRLRASFQELAGDQRVFDQLSGAAPANKPFMEAIMRQEGNLSLLNLAIARLNSIDGRLSGNAGFDDEPSSSNSTPPLAGLLPRLNEVTELTRGAIETIHALLDKIEAKV